MSPITQGALPPTAGSPGAHGVQPSASKEPSPAVLKAARDFESIFIREMLKSLEKTSQLGGKGSLSAGRDVYSSMVVDTLADAVSAGGGLGMADVVARALTEGATPK